MDGHLLLLEQLVAKARRQDLDELLLEVKERRGDFIEQLEKLDAWSAAKLDNAGREAWKALLLFPAGSAPEGPLRAAARKNGSQALKRPPSAITTQPTRSGAGTPPWPSTPIATFRPPKMKGDPD